MTRTRVIARGFTFALSQMVVSLREMVSVLRAVPLRTGSDKAREQRGLYFYAEGRAGETKNIFVTPGVLFRGTRLRATDTSLRPGKGTKIMSCFVGQRSQLPAGSSPGILTEVFHLDAVGNEFQFDTCQSGLSVLFQVLFLVDCEWSAELWGDFIAE